MRVCIRVHKQEGLKVRGRKLENRYQDVLLMALRL
jgi:hypothetical protein